jgi:hypothetical protein
MRASLFRDTPGSVKTLRKLYKDRSRDIDVDDLLAELFAENDRPLF